MQQSAPTPKNLIKRTTDSSITRTFAPFFLDHVMALLRVIFKIFEGAPDPCIFHYLHATTTKSAVKKRCVKNFCGKDTLKVTKTNIKNV